MRPSYIIIHHSLTKDSETVSWQAIRRYHMGTLRWRNIGYHFGVELVNNDYEILVGRMINATGAHCKQSEMNSRSLGICFVGNFDEKPPSTNMWTLGLWCVRGLCDVLSIPFENVRGHSEFASYKSCPGNAFDMDQFRSML